MYACIGPSMLACTLAIWEKLTITLVMMISVVKDASYVYKCLDTSLGGGALLQEGRLYNLQCITMLEKPCLGLNKNTTPQKKKIIGYYLYGHTIG